MPSDKTRSHQRVTLTIKDGRSYSGFTMADLAEHNYPTGRQRGAGAKGDYAVMGVTKEGAVHTLTHPWDPSTYRELKAAERRRGTVTPRVVSTSGATITRTRTLTGIVGAVNLGGYDASSGEPLNFTIKFNADGDDS